MNSKNLKRNLCPVCKTGMIETDPVTYWCPQDGILNYISLGYVFPKYFKFPVIVRQRVFQKTLIIRDEFVKSYFEDHPDNHVLLIKKQAYNINGDYIGPSKFAWNLVINHGIIPEKINKKYNVCQIGFRESVQKWYGWSHRAIQGFGVGDQVFHPLWKGGHSEEELDCIPFIKRGNEKIKILSQAKKAAINFAHYVS